LPGSFPPPTMPSADCCRCFSADYSPLSRFPPCRAFSDQPQLSRGKFDHFPCTTAESTLCVLDGYGLRNLALTRPTLTPLIRFLFIGSHFCSTLPSDPASRQSPCASLTLRLHQAGWRTCTSKLSSMLGTPRVRFAARTSPRFATRRPPRCGARGGAPARGLRRPRARTAPRRLYSKDLGVLAFGCLATL